MGHLELYLVSYLEEHHRVETRLNTNTKVIAEFCSSTKIAFCELVRKAVLK